MSIHRMKFVLATIILSLLIVQPAFALDITGSTIIDSDVTDGITAVGGGNPGDTLE
ncbi:MAG: hypothetical protein GWM98_12675, partial [Nitrospinaceae bacterium]|nr:hypothetical protein [Nitrospinaceae bacterium]NIR55180.1 hypothetical protein [Nitrospinaceae bacterium]NIS85604.1 hypothetical protein [Nitrospinaceae bacterium]NIT82450.1 hypothetical protein [Nitrospinaceae bacterium]NIU44663.1 hypothetical protein [Nitrospinaceae bacterium]